MYKIMLLDDEAEVRESILLQISKSSCISRICSICNADYRNYSISLTEKQRKKMGIKKTYM